MVDVRQRNRPSVGRGRLDALAIRVALEASAAEGVGPVDRHGRHRLGRRRCVVSPEAIADDREALVDAAELHADVGGGKGHAARREEAAGDEQLSPSLGETLVDHAGGAERGAHGGPEGELIEERAGRIEREAEHRGDVEIGLARAFCDPGQDGQFGGLDDLHGRLSLDHEDAARFDDDPETVQ